MQCIVLNLKCQRLTHFSNDLVVTDSEILTDWCSSWTALIHCCWWFNYNDDDALHKGFEKPLSQNSRKLTKTVEMLYVTSIIKYCTMIEHREQGHGIFTAQLYYVICNLRE